MNIKKMLLCGDEIAVGFLSWSGMDGTNPLARLTYVVEERLTFVVALQYT